MALRFSSTTDPATIWTTSFHRLRAGRLYGRDMAPRPELHRLPATELRLLREDAQHCTIASFEVQLERPNSRIELHIRVCTHAPYKAYHVILPCDTIPASFIGPTDPLTSTMASLIAAAWAVSVITNRHYDQHRHKSFHVLYLRCGHPHLNYFALLFWENPQWMIQHSPAVELKCLLFLHEILAETLPSGHYCHFTSPDHLDFTEIWNMNERHNPATTVHCQDPRRSFTNLFTGHALPRRVFCHIGDRIEQPTEIMDFLWRLYYHRVRVEAIFASRNREHAPEVIVVAAHFSALIPNVPGNAQ